VDDKISRDDAVALDRRLLWRLAHYLWPYRGWVALAFCTVMAAAFLGPLRPKLVQVAIDHHIVAGDWRGLEHIILLLVGVLLVEAVLSFVNDYLTQWIGQKAIYDIRTQVYRHIQRQSLRFFDHTPVGRLITRVTSDVESLSDMLSAGLVRILGDLFRLIFIASFMFMLEWRLALLTLSVMPFMIGAVAWFRRKVREQYRETRRQIARLNAFLQEHISGIKIVQLFNREAEEMRRFSQINDEHRQAQIKTVFYFAIFWPAVQLVSDAALGLVLWVGGLRALDGTLTLGVLIAFIQYVRQFFEPIRNLSDQYNMLQSAMAGAERIFGLLDQDTALPEPRHPVRVERLHGSIAFRNVWFTYDELPLDGQEPNWVLRDVSFTVEPGQHVAIVGATGAGKTTIINLLLRFYDVQRGQILIDGHDIREYASQDLRRHIGLVLQDVFLFSGSVRENLTLGDSSIPFEKVQEAARLIGADRFIERLPAGYDQDVRERGLTLSHGQRQLLSFVRALVHDPRILVLDEATSSVDTETEQLIQQAMETLLRGRTAIIIAHRLSTIQHADQILVLHRGEIRERGTHQELLARDGLYRRLYELQFQEQARTAA
jgi:ATP-binding cassette, subfamily B, multidrug efflux pump